MLDMIRLDKHNESTCLKFYFIARDHFFFYSIFLSFILPLCISACVISPTSFIVSCGNGAALVITCHTCPLKDKK